MAFSEKVRLEVRRAANFRCCRCHETGIDVHHIVPQAEGGPDTFENAAPLCQSCHDKFGANPQKRKEITQMRDRWYEVVAEKWPTAKDRDRKLNDAVVLAQTNPETTTLAEELRAQLDRLKAMLDEPTPATLQEVATDLVSATRLADGVYTNVSCSRCKTFYGMLVGANSCPNCGAPFQ